MKKITFVIITCTLISCSNSFGMLRHIVRTYTHTRRCHIKQAFRLQPQNIFNAFNIDEPEKTRSQLQDLYKRNDNLIRELHGRIATLKLQNHIATQHDPFLGDPVDIEKLQTLEEELEYHKNMKGL